MCGPHTRSRGRTNKSSNGADPKKGRYRKGDGNNRSRKRQRGVYPILRGTKASQTNLVGPR